MKYVSLHHHSTFSYMDGFGTPERHVERAVELGMSALALTEHGNVSSHVQHEKYATKAGIQPIFGLEAYTAPGLQTRRKWHLTILAETAEGYRNLMKLVTRSYAEGFYQYPTITGPMLAEHADGLIVLSGCADSKLACDLLGGKGVNPHPPDLPAAERTASAFKALLGDRYFIEAQQFPELERTRTLNPIFEDIARRLKIPLVATADVHYPMPDDNEMQVILHAAGRGTNNVAQQVESWEYDIRLTHPASDAVVLERLRGTGLSRRAAAFAIASTEDIAARCRIELPKVDRLRYPLPDGQSSRDLIWSWLRDGWSYRTRSNRRIQQHEAEYVARLKYEMDLITDKDFIDYFLMLSDAVRWAKDRGIPVGPARGSAAASLTCYLLRITEVDPLQFPMMYFERFIAHNRTDVPDIDLDFSDERRDELRQYLVEKYGADRVGNIGTYTKYKGKNALIDVARVNGVPDYEIKVIKDLMIDRSSGDARAEGTLEDTIAMFPQAQAVMEKFPELWKALRLEGNYRGSSVHAAGLVVANEPLTDAVATYERTSGTGTHRVTRQVVSADKYDAEHLGLMKIDALGLSTMGMIQHSLDIVGMTLDELYTETADLDDQTIIQAFRDGDVTGIFQFGGGATRIVNADVKPDTFLELADINALSRPGPLHSGSTQDYIDIKHGRKRPPTQHPAVAKITSWTKGQIIYQEQILAATLEIGDMGWVHAQEIRKIVSLKHGVAAFNMKFPMFAEGARRLHGMTEEEASDIWRRMATAGTYAFNIAHSVSYAMLAYWTMWFKVYHPAAFYAASLRKFPDEQYWLLRDALRHSIDILPPDPNRSPIHWAVEGTSVRSGLLTLPGVGEALAAEIIRDRKVRGSFDNWGELIRVKGIGPAKLAPILDRAGDDPFGIYAVERKIQTVRDWLRSNPGMPYPTHKGTEIPTEGDHDIVFLGLPVKRDSRDVIEDERGQTGEDYETIRGRMKDPDKIKRMIVHVVDDTDTTVYLRWNRWNFAKGNTERALWDMRLGEDLILVRGRKRSGFGTSIQVKDFWIINPDD